MALAPLYWCLLSLAFVHAVVRLVVEPHRWDKTPHSPDVASTVETEVVADAGREAA